MIRSSAAAAISGMAASKDGRSYVNQPSTLNQLVRMIRASLTSGLNTYDAQYSVLALANICCNPSMKVVKHDIYIQHLNTVWYDLICSM